MHDDVGDAVLVHDQDHEEDQRSDHEVPLVEVEPVLDDARPESADRVRCAEHRAEHVAETADHGVPEAVDRREHVELRVRDHLAPEADEDARRGGQPRGDGERVQLDAEHRDAERGGGALVRSHRDEPAAGTRSPEVGDEHREEHEHDETHRGPRVRVVERVDLHAEELHPTDPRAAVEGAAEVVRVREHDLRHEEAEAEGDHREVHAARPQRGNREHQADRDGEEDAEQDRELDGNVGAHEPARDQRTDAGERPLRERDLSGVAGEHHDRQDHDGAGQGDVGGLRPRVVHHPEEERERDRGGEKEAADADLRRCRASAAVRPRASATAAPGPARPRR